MKKLMYIMLFLSCFACNTPEQIPDQPFEMNHEVTCYDLIEQGYRWMTGVDVIILGKRTGDTLVYFQLEDLEDCEWPFFTRKYDDSPEMESYYDSTYDENYVTVDKEMCRCQDPFYKYYSLRIAAEDTANYPQIALKATDRIIDTLYTEYDISAYRIVNNQQDTFQAVVSNRGEYYTFSTTSDTQFAKESRKAYLEKEAKLKSK